MNSKAWPCLILAGLSFLMSACAELAIKTSTPTVESPEVVGQKGKIAIDGGYQQRREWKVTEDASDRPPTLNAQHGTYLGGPFLGGIMGVSERWELGLRASGSVDLSARVKWQVFGDGLAQAKEGGSSVALFSSYHYNQDSANGDQKGEFGPGGYPWKANGKIASWQGGLSAGYRFTKSILGFLGYAYGDYKGDYRIEHTAANGDLGGTYTGTMSGRGQTTTLGFTFGGETRLNLLASYHDLKWSGGLGSVGTSLVGNLFVPIGK